MCNKFLRFTFFFAYIIFYGESAYRHARALYYLNFNETFLLGKINRDFFRHFFPFLRPITIRRYIGWLNDKYSKSHSRTISCKSKVFVRFVWLIFCRFKRHFWRSTMSRCVRGNFSLFLLLKFIWPVAFCGVIGVFWWWLQNKSTRCVS